MDGIQTPTPTQPQVQKTGLSNVVMPSQIQETAHAMASLTKLLLEASNILIFLRREFRGEGLYQDSDGNNHWVQVSKPLFIRINFKTNQPLMKEVEMPWKEMKNVYIPNDEAIDEILSMLKFAGINQITPIANIDEGNYLDDLLEFECKLAGILALKQKEWGLDKELLPMIQFKIKTIIQDARSMCVNGNVLKALITSVQRVEQAFEGERYPKKENVSPYH